MQLQLLWLPLRWGFLIPLNKSLEEDDWAPRLPVLEGNNVIGRDNVGVTDKRLSRKHLSLSASPHHHASAHLLVEGMNPVVINSDGQKRRLSSGERVAIKNGDIIELIPGSYYFKYVTECDQGNSAMDSEGSGASRECKDIGVGLKRMRDELDLGGSDVHFLVKNKSEMKVKEESSIARNSEKSEGSNVSTTGNGEEALRYFHIPDDKIASTFRLMKVQGLPEWANTSCVSIDDVIKGDVVVAILSNYMVDIDWLLSACPALKKVPHVVVVHGEGGGVLEYMKRNKPSNWILHKPPLPISYGTHHSKAMLLIYPRGVRVIVHTANLISVDWNFKTQGLWMQDFPWKDQNEESTGCEFERDLVDYLQALKLPEVTASLPLLGRVNISASFLKKFDYRYAKVRLIASVPGYHSGPNLNMWGHMKLRSVLEQCIFNDEFKNSPLAYQFSSIGSLDEKWMAELRSSMSSGLSSDEKPLGLGEPLIIWPTVEDVRLSLEGYAAGNSIPSPVKNVEREFLKKYWAKWNATHTGRRHAMPHIKTFVRYNAQSLAWFLLTSANLSKAAWGALQKGNSQLMIRSYELGVLFLPTLAKGGSQFSCTDDISYTKDEKELVDNSIRRTKLVTLQWPEGESGDSDYEIVRLPVPYKLPPPLYSSQDIPWAWDRKYTKRDVHGQAWPRPVKLYTAQDL